MRRFSRHEVVEARFEPGRVSFQRGVGESLASLTEATGATEQVAKIGSENIVSSVDGVLRVADEMGEADLVFLGRPAQLAAVTIGDPEVGAQSPRKSATTFLPREGLTTNTALSW